MEYLLRKQKYSISGSELAGLVRATEGYSGSDITALAREAALGPIRELGDRIAEIPVDKVRPIIARDFALALQQVKPSVSKAQIKHFLDWNAEFGSGSSS